MPLPFDAEINGFRNPASSAASSSGEADHAVMIWSATPTPFHENLSIDHISLRRMIDHHDALGVDGLFLAGTCGEGPWMPGRQIRELVSAVADLNAGRMKLGVQVTENSSARTLERMESLENIPYDFEVIAQPGVFMNATPSRVVDYYFDILDRSSKPVCFYNRGTRPDFPMEAEMLAEIYSHPAVRIIKDSSRSDSHRDAALLARKTRPELAVLNGDEFECISYLEAGYDGFMTGGAILTGAHLREMARQFHRGNKDEARHIDQRAKDLLYAVYGGKTFSCWLTGLKQSLVELGIYSTAASYLKFPLTGECRNDISRAVAERWVTFGNTDASAQVAV